MDENHQDKTGSKLSTTEDNIWPPPLSPKEQKKAERLRKKSFATRMGVAGKTPWDFIQLLLIPLILAGVGYWFTAHQNQTSRDIATDEQQEKILETYLDNMSDFLKDGLLKSNQNDMQRKIARAKTLTALRQLDPGRKGVLIQFLSEAYLIVGKEVIDNTEFPITPPIINPPIISLASADLSGADLHSADLYAVVLSGAHLEGAHLEGAHLEGAYLIDADLRGAHFLSPSSLFSFSSPEGTHLSDAKLMGAKLWRTDLRGADLRGADLSEADLRGADLSEATLDETTILKGSLYNAKEILRKDPQGKEDKVLPTKWPRGVDPKAAGATEKNTFP